MKLNKLIEQLISVKEALENDDADIFFECLDTPILNIHIIGAQRKEDGIKFAKMDFFPDIPSMLSGVAESLHGKDCPHCKDGPMNGHGNVH